MNNSFSPQLIKQVIIGTKSQSRKKIFNLMNIRFQYRSPNIDEKKVKNLNNDKFDALKIAKAKAEYLSMKYRNKIIVTFDTTILFKKKTIYKCSSRECCKQTLKSFNDKSHDLHTAMIFMINNNIIKSTLTKTKIIFRNTDVKDINNYVERNFKEVSKAVGCYNIEGKGRIFFKDIFDSYFNIIGIDVINFLKTLKSI